jgi:tetratricopeptide (TPR) repeat protein
MSLLMQALKKAEQTKQKQNEISAETALSLTPPELASAHSDVATGVTTEIQLENQKQGEFTGTLPSLQELTLSPQFEEKIEEKNTTADADAESNTRTETHRIEPVLTDIIAVDAVPMRTDNQFTSHSPAQPPTQSATEKTEEHVPVPPSHQVTDAAQREPTEEKINRPRIDTEKLQAAAQAEKITAVEQQKANAVFTSKTPPYPSNRRWLPIIGIGVFIVLAGVAYVYWNNIDKDIYSGVAAARNSTTNPIQAAQVPVEIGDAASKSNEALENANTAPSVNSPTLTPSETINASSTNSQSPQLLQSNKQASTVDADIRKKINPPQNLQENQKESQKENPIAEIKPRSAQITLTNDANAIHIKKSSSGNQINPMLANAYQLLTTGDPILAEKQYKNVLQQEPNNRDALLGLAAIALNQRQAERAGTYYVKLLDLDPNDPEAIAGLTSLQQGDPVQSESRLKKALNQHPNAGALLFALGNLYAQQARWSDAQQTYFRAYASTPNNADYAFNLAVSLDRLNQSKLALEYYQRALVLGQNGPGNFSKAAVQNRIKDLSGE